MKRDSRLSGVLHVLLHLAEAKKPLTSEQLAWAMHSHAVVVRRTMAGLRDLGLVHSEKGHGGGWSVACDFSTTTLYDIWLAIGSPALLAMGNRTESPGCLVEKAVNESLNTAFSQAENVLLEQFKARPLQVLADKFHRDYPSFDHLHGEATDEL